MGWMRRESNVAKWAIVEISNKVLEDLMPEGTKIIEIIPPNRERYRSPTFKVVVENEELDDVPEGALMKYVGVEMESPLRAKKPKFI
jgi:hypothetical protein